MRLAFQLAYRNLIGAGLRTWLSVVVLSFAFIMILFFNGLIDGWHEQALRDSVHWEYGQGQLHQENYNADDLFSIPEAHAKIPAELRAQTTPILVRQGTIYPQGRMLSVLLKGISENQTILSIPTKKMFSTGTEIPAIIGQRMAQSANLKEGSHVLLRWRDKNGTFDARSIIITSVFDTHISTVDKGQIWLPITDLQQMVGLPDEATILVAHQNKQLEASHWVYKSQQDLLKPISDLIAMKKTSSSMMYLLLLSIALLAIFDTQVLSIFRRQKEIGTYIALGMTRWQVVGLFTVEGTMYSLFAMVVGCFYGIPLLFYTMLKGISVSQASQDMSIATADRIYPVYTPTLLFSTMALVVILATIVSFLPARKIAYLNPILAIKGKIQ